MLATLIHPIRVLFFALAAALILFVTACCCCPDDGDEIAPVCDESPGSCAAYECSEGLRGLYCDPEAPPSNCTLEGFCDGWEIWCCPEPGSRSDSPSGSGSGSR